MSHKSAPEGPVFLDQDDTPPKLTDASFILREHLSGTLDSLDITEMLKV